MNDLLSPKQIARAINVSESSIKRWCDKGLIPTHYTAGGHRRVCKGDLVAFIRQERHPVVDPAALGLPTRESERISGTDLARSRYAEALLRGDDAVCRQILLDLYLGGRSVASICDAVVAAAFHEIGDAWECGEAEVYQERRGCEITLRLLHELRSLSRVPKESAPLALGGTPSGDPYVLPSAMAELVLRDAGWNATALGDNLPFDTLKAAIRDHRPAFFWLSCSVIESETEFLRNYASLREEFAGELVMAVGGVALTPAIRSNMHCTSYCDNMVQLEQLALSMKAGLRTA